MTPGKPTSPGSAFTYRVGAFVIDKRDGTMCQVMGHVGPHVQVRLPGGGLEWDVPASALRLATKEERRAGWLREDGGREPEHVPTRACRYFACAACAARGWQ
ncbi:hypothetical protein ACFP1Z_20570 [Streptomyces gamaensis]|uniref:Nudix hydrolase domain-containing protein n=1 Tax=Streptomyces gamaensis TaxID=1763542 RepID=A0ABW0Z371_9ACTN